MVKKERATHEYDGGVGFGLGGDGWGAGGGCWGRDRSWMSMVSGSVHLVVCMEEALSRGDRVLSAVG